MAADLLIVAALLVVTGAVVVGVCCWPAIAPRRRYPRSSGLNGTTPPTPIPPTRDDFQLGA
jgi:hypothetical protein